jgi:hypothetical protein
VQLDGDKRKFFVPRFIQCTISRSFDHHRILVFQQPYHSRLRNRFFGPFFKNTTQQQSMRRSILDHYKRPAQMVWNI